MFQARFRAVLPELPSPEAWLPYLEQSYAERWFTNFGPANAQFEARLLELFGRPGEAVVTVSNATSGLSACLIAEAVSGPVLCPAFTFQATAAAILGANCSPLIVDVDPVSGVVAPDILERGLRESGAKAAIVLAPYGLQTDFSSHEDICRRMGRLLLIDNAAGLGISRMGQSYSGASGNVREVFSLHATKPFGIGEGGAVFLPSEKAAQLRSATNFALKGHGATGHPAAPFWGVNAKLSEVHAAIGLAVADTVVERIAGRQAMAQRWSDCLAGSSAMTFCTEPAKATWQVFPVLLQSDAHVIAATEAAAARGIELRRYYAPSLGECIGMPRLSQCPNAQNLAQRALALPMRSALPVDEQHALMEQVRDCIVGS